MAWSTAATVNGWNMEAMSGPASTGAARPAASGLGEAMETPHPPCCISCRRLRRAGGGEASETETRACAPGAGVPRHPGPVVSRSAAPPGSTVTLHTDGAVERSSRRHEASTPHSESGTATCGATRRACATARPRARGKSSRCESLNSSQQRVRTAGAARAASRAKDTADSVPYRLPSPTP